MLFFASSCFASSPSNAPLCPHPWTFRGPSTTAVSPARWAHPWATPASAPALQPALPSAPTRKTLQAQMTTVSSQVRHGQDRRVGAQLVFSVCLVCHSLTLCLREPQVRVSVGPGRINSTLTSEGRISRNLLVEYYSMKTVAHRSLYFLSSYNWERDS